MNPPIEPLRFVGTHRIQAAIQISETRDSFQIGPRSPDQRVFRDLMIGMFTLLALALIACFLTDWVIVIQHPNPQKQRVLSAALITFCWLAMFVPLLMFWAFAEREFAKGPVLIFDRARRVVSLPRLKREVPVDAVTTVALLSGPYQWSDEVDEHWEISLILAEADRQPSVLPIVIARGDDPLAAHATRLATELGCPLHLERLDKHGRPVVDRRKLGCIGETCE